MFKQWLNKQNVKELNVFDFNDTLVYMPTEQEGKRMIQQHNSRNPGQQIILGRRYASSKESLEPPIVPDPAPLKMLNIPIATEFRKSKRNRNALTVVLTGRPPKLRSQIERILNDYELEPDRLYLVSEKELTIIGKVKQLVELLNEFPNIESVNIYDDKGAKKARLLGNNENHIQDFKKFFSYINHIRMERGQEKLKVKVNEVPAKNEKSQR